MKRVKKHATFITTKFHVPKKAKLHFPIDKTMIILIAVFIFGLILGAFYIKFFGNEHNLVYIKNLLHHFYLKGKESSFLWTFCVSFLFALAPFCILYYFGLSLLGKHVIVLALTCQGVLLGAFASYLYKFGALCGLSYFCAFYLFPLIFYCAHFLFACKESLLTVKDFQKQLINGQNNVNGKSYIKLYTIRFLLFSGGNIIPAFIFATENFIFKNKFIPDFLF